ncbi:uncharacterized protein [Antedon mediterranea]|uniref:uncharacterized protein n=1 Tax=Antedon mediterranea TaxID=105859 RepID=UPI003AF59464
MYSLPSYRFIYKNRHNKRGGGIGLYLPDNAYYAIREDLSAMMDQSESLFVEVEHQNKNIVYGVIYRPPDKCSKKFNEQLGTVMDIINSENKDSYLVGDYNIDLANHTESNVQMHTDTLFSHSFIPIINKPTRVTANTASIINNILTNSQQYHQIESGIIYTDISDHYPIFCINKSVKTPTKHVHKYKLQRSYSRRNQELFRTELERQDWENVISSCYANESYVNFHNTLNRLIDKCFPLKNIHVRANINKSPWITEGIAISIRKKEKLYSLYRKNPTLYRKSKYTNYRNKLTKLIRLRKTNYLNEEFEKNKNNSKKTWRNINNLLGKNYNSGKPSKMFLNTNYYNNEQDQAEAMNSYFINIGKNIATDIKNKRSNRIDPLTLMSGNYANSMFIRPVNEHDIKKYIDNLDISKSPGNDGIGARYIKPFSQCLTIPIKHIVNISLTTGCFPDELKIARTVPIFKGGDENDITNYRPVSVLPCISKIYERVVYDQTTQYLDKLNIINKSQFGFRKNHSTSHALSQTIEKITSAIDEQMISIGVFLDLSKAFDTIDHEILLQKLKFYGIRGIVLEWFKSYLYMRKQYVHMGNCKSELKLIEYGVPQGSILGPLLFIIYTNDIVESSKYLEFVIFADDTNVFFKHKDINLLINTLNTELSKLSDWFTANKLSLNTKKTKFIEFRSMYKKKDTNNYTLFINDVEIERVSKIKFLGVILDEFVTFHDHIDIITMKIARVIGVMNKLKYIVQSDVLLIMYNSLILPHLIYAITIWGVAGATKLQRIHILQKRAIRIICKVHYQHPSANLFYNKNLLNIFDLYEKYTAVFMFQFRMGNLPVSFNSFFTKMESVHEYGTRKKSDFRIPLKRTNIGQRSIAYRGANIWNRLPENIKCETKIGKFKKEIQQLLINKYSLM